MSEIKDFLLVNFKTQEVRSYSTDKWNDDKIFDPLWLSRKSSYQKDYVRWKGRWEYCDAMACDTQEQVNEALALAYTIPFVRLEHEITGLRECLQKKEIELEQLKQQLNEKAKNTRTTSN